MSSFKAVIPSEARDLCRIEQLEISRCTRNGWSPVLPHLDLLGEEIACPCGVQDHWLCWREKAPGAVPTCTAHTKEYVRFWQGMGKSEEPIPPLSIWETGARYERHAQMWNEVDSYVLGAEPIETFIEKTGPDHATDIIEAMWAGLDKPFFINTANEGVVPNMPADAFLEVMCDVNMDAVIPRPVGDAPVGLRGLWQQVLDAHELSVRAAVECDRDLLNRAFVCDPLVSSLADSRAMIDELLAAERDVLPDAWHVPMS